MALSVVGTGDYDTYAPVSGDNAGPAINALIHGNFSAFAAHQPLMGPVSLLLRAPFAGLAALLGGGDQLTYRLGALACMLPVAIFAGWLISTCGSVRLPSRSTSIGWLAGALAAFVLLLGHATYEAIQAGHPEEPLTAVLATVAVLAAIRARPAIAGVTLGLAIATKEWALIAVVPMLIALPCGRRRAAAYAALLAAALTAPAVIANPGSLVHSGSVLAGRRLVNPLSIWWPFGTPVDVLGAASKTVRQLPAGLTRLRLAELLVAGGLAAVVLARTVARRSVRVHDPLALLALLGLIRFIGDPLPQEYYLEALLVPLAVWEVLVAARLPLVRSAAAAFVAMVPGDALHLSPDAMSAITIGCALALACYLVRRIVHDPNAERVRRPASPWATCQPGPRLSTPRLIARGR